MWHTIFLPFFMIINLERTLIRGKTGEGACMLIRFLSQFVFQFYDREIT